MTLVLNIQSSPNPESASRAISGLFLDRYREGHPEAEIVDLDLAAEPPRHVGTDHLGAYFAPPEYHTPGNAEALKGSEAYISQLMEADLLVIGTPMHNLGVSSVLKSWIDNVCRIGRTFRYDNHGATVGLLAPGKRAVVVVGCGGIYSSGPMQAFDYASTYMSAILRLMGVHDITVIHAEATTLRPELSEPAMANARSAAIRAAIARENELALTA